MSCKFEKYKTSLTKPRFLIKAFCYGRTEGPTLKIERCLLKLSKREDIQKYYFLYALHKPL